MIDAVLAVGRDCDCGNPLIWHGSTTWCAVYGTHPPDEPVGERLRNRHAVHARLVEELTAMTWPERAA